MIPIKRPAESPEIHDALLKPFPRHGGKTEIERARAHYNQNPPPKKAYPFVRYREWQVRKALDNLFHEKCAYCESSYRAVDARDIEHFRPKGGIAECPGHTGYWWLADVWTNLLASCPACNQYRRQTKFDPSMTLEELEALRQEQPQGGSGKANSFPVVGNNWITGENQSIDLEDPLLINPCERDPGNHLEWVFFWNHGELLWETAAIVAFVRPKLASGADDPYAQASIAIYGLNRSGLVRHRMEHLRGMQRVCQFIVELIGLLGDASPTNRGKIRDSMKRHLQDLEEFARPEKPYAAMARAFIELFRAELANLH